MKYATHLIAVLLASTSLAVRLPISAQQPLLVEDSFKTSDHSASFDYVIVGGGTAGLAVAYRLAEDGSKSVAVIEAGGFYETENGNISVVPAYNQEYDYTTPDSQWYNKRTDWGFLTTPQAGAQAQIYHYGRGKMLGGCSAQNALNYQRPTKGTLQDWTAVVNDSSYTWDEFLPYFERITYTNADASIRAPNASTPSVISPAGAGHPLQVSFPSWATPLASWAQLAFREMGILDTHSQVEGELIGSQYNALTLDPTTQTRSSSQSSYLDAALNSGRTNLHVFTHTLAKRILFDQDKTAYGVVVQGNISSQLGVLTARKQIIVSAGAFQSPQLLMVSGVGPSEILTQHNISVVADRPGVGQNMWDHAVLTFAHRVNLETYGRLTNATLLKDAINEYNENRTGILTNDLSDYLGWEKMPAYLHSKLSASAQSDLTSFASDWPDIEYEVASAPFGTPPFSTTSDPIDVAYLQAVLQTPMSRGNISIVSADMADPPVINPDWLTHPTDQEVAVATFKRARQFFRAKAIAPALIGDELMPGKELPDDASDEQILLYVQKILGLNWHAACTCKMGEVSDPMTVVDSQARVIGVKDLRVVDASAFPLLPPGHPQATVYALAEKIAAQILAEAKSVD